MYRGIAAVWMTGQRTRVCAAEDCCKLAATSQITLPVTGQTGHYIPLLDAAACETMSKYSDYTAARQQDEPPPTYPT